MTDPRGDFIEYLLHADEKTQREEIRQFLLDAMDITEQGPLEEKVIAAFRAFENI